MMSKTICFLKQDFSNLRHVCFLNLMSGRILKFILFSPSLQTLEVALFFLPPLQPNLINKPHFKRRNNK